MELSYIAGPRPSRLSPTYQQIQPVPLLSGPEALVVARRFAGEIRPGAADRDRAPSSPTAELAVLARTGLLALTVPAEHGGPGASYEVLARAVAAIAGADASLAQITQGHFWAVQILLEDGSPEQLAQFLPKVLAGSRIGNAVSERNTAHAGEIRTYVTHVGDDVFQLDGTKFYSTGSIDSDWIQVMALDDDGREVAVYVERDAEGVEVIDDWSAMGQRSTASGTSTYTAVRVGANRIVPHWRTLARPTLFASVGQIVHAAVDAGLAAGALDAIGQFVRERSRPHFEAARLGWERAADEPFVLQRYGQLAARVHAAEELLARAGRIMDEARAGRVDADSAAAAAVAVGEAKAFAGDIALEVTNEMFALAGTRSVDPRHNLDRYWRDARTHTLHDPNRWKYFHAGNYALNGIHPPSNGIN
jgi:SfnB family sulfur acquisition oxidoreductase